MSASNGHFESDATSALAAARRALAQGDAQRAANGLVNVLGMLPPSHVQHREARRLMAEAHVAQGNARAADIYLRSLNETIEKKTDKRNSVATARSAAELLLALEAEPNALATHAQYVHLLLSDDETALRGVLKHVVQFAVLEPLRDSAPWWRFVVDTMRKVAALESRLLAPARVRVELHAYDELARLSLALGAANVVASSGVLEACGALRDAVLAAQHFLADDTDDTDADAADGLLQLHEFAARVHWRYATAFLQLVDSLVADKRPAADVAPAVRRAFDALWRTLSVQMADDDDHFAAERLSHAGRAMYELVERFPDVITDDEPGTPRRAPPAASDDEVLFGDDDVAHEPVRDARSSRVAMQAFVINRLVTADQALAFDSHADVEKVVALLVFYFRWRLYRHARTVVEPLFAALYSMPAVHLDLSVLGNRAIGALDVDMLLMALFVDVYRAQFASADAMVEWALSDTAVPPPVPLARVAAATAAKPSAQFARLWRSMLWQQRLNEAVFAFERPSNVLSLRGVCAHIAAVREALFADALTIAYTVRALHHIADDSADMLVDIEASPLTRARLLEQELRLRVERAVEMGSAAAFAPPGAADGPAAAAGAVPLFVVDTSLTIAGMCRVAGRLESALGMHSLAGKLFAASGTVDGSVDAAHAFQRALRQNQPLGEAQRVLSQALAVVGSALRTLDGVAATDATRAQAGALRDAETWFVQHAAQCQLDVNAPAVELRAPPLGAVQVNGGAAPPNTPLMRPRPIVQQHGRGTPIFGAPVRTPLPPRPAQPQTEPARVAGEPETLALPQSRRAQKQLARLAELRAQASSELAQFGTADTSTPSKPPAAVPSSASTAAVVRRLEFSAGDAAAGAAATAVPSPFKFGDASAETKRPLATVASGAASAGSAPLGAAKSDVGAAAAAAKPVSRWKCVGCNNDNDESAMLCGMCASKRPAAAVGTGAAPSAPVSAPSTAKAAEVAPGAPKANVPFTADPPKTDPPNASPPKVDPPKDGAAAPKISFGAPKTDPPKTDGAPTPAAVAAPTTKPAEAAPKFSFGAPKTDSGSAAPPPVAAAATPKATPTFGFGGAVAAAPPTVAAQPASGWKCAACEGVNDESAKQCATCLANRPVAKAGAAPSAPATAETAPKFSFGAPKADVPAKADPLKADPPKADPAKDGATPTQAAVAPKVSFGAPKTDPKLKVDSTPTPAPKPVEAAPKFSFGAPKVDSGSAAPPPVAATAKATPTFGFGGAVAVAPPTVAAMPASGWKCAACEGVNDESAKQCATCLANRPAAKADAGAVPSAPVAAPSTTKTTPVFSFGAPKTDGAPTPAAVAAPTTKPAEAAPKFSFGAPKTDSGSAAAPPVAATAKATPTFGFGGAVAAAPPTVAAKPASGWKCAACEGVNDESAKQCATCLANRPAAKADAGAVPSAPVAAPSTTKTTPVFSFGAPKTDGAPTPAAVAAPTTKPAEAAPKFSFGAPKVDSGSAAPPPVAATAKATPTFGFGGAVAAAPPTVAAKPASGWKCAACEGVNDESAKQCATCLANRPAAKADAGAVPSAPVAAPSTTKPASDVPAKVDPLKDTATTPAASAAPSTTTPATTGPAAKPKAFAFGAVAPTAPATGAPKASSEATATNPPTTAAGAAPSRFNFLTPLATAPTITSGDASKPFVFGSGAAKAQQPTTTAPAVAPVVASFSASTNPAALFSFGSSPPVPAAAKAVAAVPAPSLADSVGETFERSAKSHRARTAHQVDDDEVVARVAAPAGSIFAAAAKGQLTVSDDDGDDNSDDVLRKPPKSPRTAQRMVNPIKITTLTSATLAPPTAAARAATSPAASPAAAASPAVASPAAVASPTASATPVPRIAVTTAAPSDAVTPATVTAPKTAALATPAVAASVVPSTPTPTTTTTTKKPSALDETANKAKALFAAMSGSSSGFGGATPFTGATPSPASQKGSFAAAALAEFGGDSSKPATPAASASVVAAASFSVPKSSAPPAVAPTAARQLFSFGTVPKPSADGAAVPAAAEPKPAAAEAKPVATPTFSFGAAPKVAGSPATDAASASPFPFGGAKLPAGTSPFAAVAAGTSGFPTISFPKAGGSTVKPMQSSLFGVPPQPITTGGDGDDDDDNNNDDDNDDGDDDENGDNGNDDDDDGEGGEDDGEDDDELDDEDDDEGELDEAASRGNIGGALGKLPQSRLIHTRVSNSSGPTTDGDDDDDDPGNGDEFESDPKEQRGAPKPARASQMSGLASAAMSSLGGTPTFARPMVVPMSPFATPLATPAPTPAPTAPVAPVAPEPAASKSLFGDLDPSKPLNQIKFGSQEGSSMFGLKPSEGGGGVAVAAEKPRLPTTAATTPAAEVAKAPAKFNFGAPVAESASTTLATMQNPFQQSTTAATTTSAAASAPVAAPAKFNFGAPAAASAASTLAAMPNPFEKQPQSK